jgi:hypothetical protein
MGKTAFSGPVYGSKSLLWSAFVLVGTSGVSATYAVTTVPNYEDWFATETFFACSSCSTGAASISSVATFVISDDSSNLHAPVSMTSTASGVLTTVTPDAGEYEGKQIVGGSTLAFVIAAGSTALPVGSARAELRGYIRYKSSTRAEA